MPSAAGKGAPTKDRSASVRSAPVVARARPKPSNTTSLVVTEPVLVVKIVGPYEEDGAPTHR